MPHAARFALAFGATLLALTLLAALAVAVTGTAGNTDLLIAAGAAAVMMAGCVASAVTERR